MTWKGKDAVEMVSRVVGGSKVCLRALCCKARGGGGRLRQATAREEKKKQEEKIKG